MEHYIFEIARIFHILHSMVSSVYKEYLMGQSRSQLRVVNDRDQRRLDRIVCDKRQVKRPHLMQEGIKRIFSGSSQRYLSFI